MAEGLRPDGCFDRIHPSANFDSVGCVADTSAVVAKDVALAVADTSTSAAAAADNLYEKVQLAQH